MQHTGAIKVTKAERSKREDTDFSNLSFGKYFTDHMLVADYHNGVWSDPEIVPYAPICFDPSMATLHYGQSIFEGIKAYRMQDGKAAIFRPIENFKRFNRSAQRMEMAEVPEHIFMDGMKKLLEVEDQWIPKEYDHALYIRPFMFATDEQLGVAPSTRYKFLIICSPVGPFYPAPLRLYVEEQFVRAVPGGVGNAKTSGNYAASLHPTAVAKKRGYDQVLWTDAFEHKYVQECGTMNVFFVMNGKLITPGLESGTILQGITRDSVIKVARDMGKVVEEREISVDELVAAYEKGIFTEAFGAGTAATISKITELRYKEFSMSFDPEAMIIANEIKSILTGIRDGVAPDPHGWMFPVAG
ncbi:MAG: branched-chain amino acid aminotransferase [bacterium]